MAAIARVANRRMKLLDNKANQARIALVEAFQRGELSFTQMAKKAKRINAKPAKKPKKPSLPKTP